MIPLFCVSIIMLASRRTSYLLLVINLALILFIMIRAGSEEIDLKARNPRPLTFHKIEPVEYPGPDTLILNDFEKANDATNMYWQGGEFTKRLTSEHVFRGARSLMIDRDIDENIELATVHFPVDWDGYDFLEFDLFNDSDSTAAIWVRMGNRYDAIRFYVSSQKYSQDFALYPGWNTISIPLADIAEAFGTVPARKSLHFNFPPGRSGRFFFDFMRVIRHDGSDE